MPTENDVTGNHASVQILSESGYLSAIIESSDDAIISKTLEGVITSWNNSARRIFGYTADEVIGKPVTILIPPDRIEEEPEILAKLRKGERVDHFETKRMTRDGKLIDISLTISPIKDAHGKIIGISKIARDITDKKREEQLRHDFIAMVSHELKTPLTSLKSYNETLLRIFEKNDDKFVRHALERSRGQINRMVTMINDYLDMSRLKEAKLKLDIRDFRLDQLIEEVVRDARMFSSYENIEIHCQAGMVRGDRDKIGQVLTNLISNAVKYSPNKETITVRCKAENDRVHVWISDQGIGIAEKDQQRLFERFYRAEHETLNYVSGFGVGLYIVAELLRCHGSRIQVHSSPGQGSTFTFDLPRGKEELSDSGLLPFDEPDTNSSMC